jgi:hypothetical protein
MNPHREAPPGAKATRQSIDEWIENQALMLVGSAAVLVEYKKWKELEKIFAARLREAYEMNH